VRPRVGGPRRSASPVSRAYWTLRDHIEACGTCRPVVRTYRGPQDAIVACSRACLVASDLLSAYWSQRDAAPTADPALNKGDVPSFFADSPKRRGMGAAVLVALALFVLFVPTGNSSASGFPPVYGFSTPDGSFVLPYENSLVLGPQDITPGQLVFGDSISLEFVNDGGNRSVLLTTNQTLSGNSPLLWNETFYVPARNVTILTFDLPSEAQVHDIRLCIDDGCIHFLHQTPVTLIPSGILNIGGLDLILFSIVIEMSIFLIIAIPAAKSLTRRGIWAPNFRVWLYAPHVILGFVLLVVFDYQAFDLFFGGLEFVLFPMISIAFLFPWMLHFFNGGTVTEALQPDPQAGHRLRYRRWKFIMGDLADGRKVLVGTKWIHFFGRVRGHHAVLVPARSEGKGLTVPALAPTDTYEPLLGARMAAFHSRTGKDTPLDDFEIAGDGAIGVKEKNPPKLLVWVESGAFFDGELPHLSWHRDVLVEARTDAAGNVLRPAYTKRKLALPHFIDPPDNTTMKLAALHYLDAPLAALGWIRTERAYKRIRTLHANVNALRVGMYASADEFAEASEAGTYQLFEAMRSGLSPEAALEQTRREVPTGPQAPTPTDVGSSMTPTGFRPKGPKP